MTKVGRVCDSIIAQIESGALRDGNRLASEEQLAAGFGVSVGTVQKALARLASAGLVSREHGRGTFVSGTRISPADLNYIRFRDPHGNDLPDYVRLKAVRRENRRGPWVDFLGGETGCIRIERTISVAGRFDLYSEFWLGQAEFARLDGAGPGALESNLRLLLGQRLALPTLKVDQLIRFERLPARVAAMLGLAIDAPGFVMEVRGYTLRDRPLFYQRVYSGPFTDSLVIAR